MSICECVCPIRRKKSKFAEREEVSPPDSIFRVPLFFLQSAPRELVFGQPLCGFEWVAGHGLSAIAGQIAANSLRKDYRRRRNDSHRPATIATPLPGQRFASRAPVFHPP